MDWMLEHSDLLRSIVARSSGAIGELLVAHQLKSFGYAARPATINARQCDLIVTSPIGREFSIEVKSVKDRGSPYLVRSCPDVEASSYWIFVHAPRADDELPNENEISFRVLTTEEVASIWLAKFDGKPNKAPDITWRDLGILAGRDDPHLNRWDKLPDWSAR